MEIYPHCESVTTILECDVIKVGDVIIISPTRIPCCLMSLIVGWTCAYKIHKLKYVNNGIYSIVFFFIGIMMTCAAIYDCFLEVAPPQYDLAKFIFAITDLSLTGSIGVGFGFCGLADIKLLKTPCQAIVPYLMGVVFIFSQWILSFINDTMNQAFLVLYLGCVTIGCGVWVICELYLFVKNRNCNGFKYCIAAAIAGLFGLESAMNQNLDMAECRLFSCYFAGQFFWFAVTPLCAYLIFKFYEQSHKPVQITHQDESQVVMLLPQETQQIQLVQMNQQYIKGNNYLHQTYQQQEYQSLQQQYYQQQKYIPAHQDFNQSVVQQQQQQQQQVQKPFLYFIPQSNQEGKHLQNQQF